MTSNTQTSNMSAMKVNTFVKAFMVKAKDEGDGDDEAYDAAVALILERWESEKNQAELRSSFKQQRNSSGKKNKKLKDKNAPKRGKSAYIYFCGDFRAAAKAELGDDATLGQVGKELGRLWHEAKYAKKIGKYTKLAATDKERYEKEMETYERPSDEELEEQNKGKRKKSSKKKRKSSGKKRGKSGYMFFCAEERPKIKQDLPDLAPKEVMVELGKRWKEAKKGDTSKWDELAKKSKEEAAQANSSGEEDVESPAPPSGEDEGGSPPPSAEDDDSRSEEDELVEEVKKPVKKKSRKPVTKNIWKVETDSKSGKTYYYNTKTRKTQWTKPDEMEDEAPAPKKKKGTGKRIYAMHFWKKKTWAAVLEETGLEGTELTKEMSKRWKALSKDEKAEWKSKAKAAE
jgi:hypothetical protein